MRPEPRCFQMVTFSRLRGARPGTDSRGEGERGELRGSGWEGKAGWAPLRPVQLIPQRSFWHISGCRGSNRARTPLSNTMAS